MSARISDLSDMRARYQALERPGVAKAQSSKKRIWKNRASARLAQVLADETSNRAVAEACFEADESALRRALNGAEAGLSLAWILEAMLDNRPDLLKRYLRSFLDDLERLPPTGSDDR